MTPRAKRLYETADGQIAELSARLATVGAADLARPCPGRAKLGDGTIGAVAAHVADSYQRIAAFGASHRAGAHALGPPDHGRYRGSEVDPEALRARLASARRALAAIGELGDEQLDSVPPAGELRFADGKRTLEQVVASQLRHQRHHVDALTAAL